MKKKDERWSKHYKILAFIRFVLWISVWSLLPSSTEGKMFFKEIRIRSLCVIRDWDLKARIRKWWSLTLKPVRNISNHTAPQARRLETFVLNLKSEYLGIYCHYPPFFGLTCMFKIFHNKNSMLIPQKNYRMMIWEQKVEQLSIHPCSQQNCWQ